MADNFRRQIFKSMNNAEYFVEFQQRYFDNCFFSPKTMRFHGSRVCYAQGIRKTPNGLYFMYSDNKCFNDNTRVYKISWWSVDKDNFHTVFESESRYQAVKKFEQLSTEVDFDTTQEL